MLKNHIKIALRNFLKYKTYSFINVVGLAVGMTCFILISMWVQDELSYDGFHEKIDQLYRVTDYEKYSNGDEVYFSQNAALLGPILKDKYPEILDFVRYRRHNGIVRYGDKKFNQGGFGFTDQAFFDLFSFPIVQGNKETLLSDPFSEPTHPNGSLTSLSPRWRTSTSRRAACTRQNRRGDWRVVLYSTACAVM